MANPINEDGANYISKLSMNGTIFTIKDAWARGEIDEVKKIIEGGTHFLGVTTSELSDGATTNPITVKGEEVTAENGDIALCTVTEGGASITAEFIFDGTTWQQFGTQGVLKALAYKDSASGDVVIPLSANITAESYTPQVSKGTLAVTTGESSVSTTAAGATVGFTSATATLGTSTVTVNVSTEETAAAVTTAATAASVTYTETTVTAAGPTVTLGQTTGTFTALQSVTYDETTATLSISNGTSDEFLKTTTVESVGDVTMKYDKTTAVTYDKVVDVTYIKPTTVTYTKVDSATYQQVETVTYDKASGTFLSSASLSGDLAVTAAAPTLTITNPTVTVTVS